jgi:hypothetical protein
MSKHPGFRNLPARGRIFDTVKPTETSDEVRIGIGRMVTYALGVWPTEIVSRKTLRALLPRGETKWIGAVGHWNSLQKGTSGTQNRVSKKFQDQLYRLEHDGLIRRGQDFIQIVDGRALFDRALDGVHNPSHRKFLDLDKAAAEVEAQLKAEALPEMVAIRRKELAAIRELMKSTGGRDSRRRLVRQESGAIDIPLGATTGKRPKTRTTPTFPVERKKS